MAERNRRRARAALLTGSALATTAVALLAFAGSGSAAAAAIPTNTSSPTISGTEQAGRELTANRGNWTGNPTDYDYQWQRCNSGGSGCSDISGATDNQYTLGSADVGNRVRVGVTAQNSDGTSPPKYSGTSNVVAAAGSAPANTSPQTITGTAQDNQRLAAASGNWSGSTPITFTYRWQRCNANGGSCSNISGATGQTYGVTANDVGRRLRVVVTASNSAGSSSAVSATTDVATAAGTAPTNTSAPAITGTAQDNQTLSVNPGAWSGNATITFTYQWLRCDGNGDNCQSIPGATGATYRATSGDVGHRLRVAVTGRNGYGSSTATSGASAVATAAGPAGAIKLPNGTTSIPVTSVSLPNRLIIDKVSFTPPTIGSRSSQIVAKFRVVDSNGYVVRDALVYAIGVPSNRVSVPPEAATDQSGVATLAYIPLRGLPLRKGAMLTIFVRARKGGENILGGVSARRLVSIRIRPV